MAQGAHTKHFARGLLGGSYGPDPVYSISIILCFYYFGTGFMLEKMEADKFALPV